MTHYLRRCTPCRAALAGLLAVATLLAAGCEQGARRLHLDHELADESFEAFLQTWKSGSPQTALQQRSPQIISGDHDWANGWQLASYRRGDVDVDDGTNRHFAVELELVDPQGRTRTQHVVFIVGTSPVITVFRK